MKTTPYLFIICLLVGSPAFAESINLDAIKKIESGGCASPCIGDKGRSLGPYQIKAAVVSDYNKAHGTKHPHKAVLDPLISRRIALWAFDQDIPRRLRLKGLKTDTQTKIQAWNRGVAQMQKKPKVPKTTKKYIEKYNRYVK